MKNRTVSEENNKPALDEQTLAKLLEAAYVLQEHNREMQELELCLDLKREQLEAESRAAMPQERREAPAPASVQTDYTVTVAQIVEAQHHIQIRKMDLDSAMSLVAERVVQIAGASGAAIGIINGKSITYRSVSGAKTPVEGAEVSLDKALCVPCIKTGQAFRCADVNPEFLLDVDECRRRGIQSLIAVPIFHEGGVAGALELYYPNPNGFSEQDVHTCQLMAGLVTEALVRDEELTWKKSLATERAAMLEALEKLKPNLAALMGQTQGTNHDQAAEAPVPPLPVPVHDYACRKCGHELLGEEMFCGQCGTPRATDYEAPSMQSKVATLWEMQESNRVEATASTDAELSAEPSQATSEDVVSARSLAHVLEERMPDLFRESELPADESSESYEVGSSAGLEQPEEDLPTTPEAEAKTAVSTTTLAPTLTKPADWSSAASARQFLEELTSSKRRVSLIALWNTRRGDLYLAIAVILVLCVIWALWANGTRGVTAAPPAAAAHRKSPEADLPLFDRMLISLGLAEPPQAPADRGNPSIQVWVDQRTALYYCPGTDLYGKTPKGKFTSQRDAQLDQFEPAYRKPCN